ncbi:hypothetical protein O181_102776 [Austropuccinia psidii MF-1]|uniref:Reverse transcriptase Ty1/copia-type domain-containing protein n=1 Tax=Austropuccinia psidii MF-1 TaxID=1389203 RepID=A0A9Q3PJV8_9BASI|nr:hypothetical protein [Austropuccinia psidii MF-1]
MIDEIESQDRLITAISSKANPAMLLPTTYQEVLKSPNKKEWVEAIDKELASLIKEDIFEYVNLRQALAQVPHESILSTKLVFVKKPDRYKARLVA